MRSEDDFRKCIQACHWRFAKTMPQWPHEYTVRKFEDPQEGRALFEHAVAFMREQGERRTFEPTGKSAMYLDMDGRQYWTMGSPIKETMIINRAWLDLRERLAEGRPHECGQ